MKASRCYALEEVADRKTDWPKNDGTNELTHFERCRRDQMTDVLTAWENGKE